MNITSRIVGTLFGCLGLLMGVACAPTPPLHPALPVIVSFPMDKAGQTARIDFSVIEGQANLKRRLMVGLDFPQTRNFSIENIIQKTDVPVHVEVYFVDKGKMTPVVTQDDEAIMASANGSKTKTDMSSVAKLDIYAHDGHTSNVLVAGFYAAHYGNYVAIIKTVKDLPMFKNINTELKVDKFYNTGE